VRVAIVGAGFSGLGMAIRLEQAGMHDFVVLERRADVGGTWYDNSYPGCQCDVPSHLYSFSFEPNPDWSRTFSCQPEIWAYLRRCAERHGLIDHIRFDHELLGAAWCEDERRWRLETSRGPLAAEVVISAVGGLSEPSTPALEGLDRFQGASFHTAQWDHEHELAGERVAVIGTGASAIQVIPKIQPRVGRLRVFQRTPPWVLPHSDRPVSRAERRLYRALPLLQRVVRAGIYVSREWLVLGLARHRGLMKLPEAIGWRHLRRQVPDRELRRKLTPHFTIGCKRILLSDDYYHALTQPNVEVVTEGIERVEADAIVTRDGARHEVDTIIFGTGFRVTEMPWADRVVGRDGRTLNDVWQGSPQAYLGCTVSGFPNMFVLVGPNTGLGHNSIVYMIESQLAYVMDALQTMRRRGLATVDVRLEVQARFNAEVQEQMRGTVWTAGGCASWYLDSQGRNSTLWPGFTFDFRRRTARFALADYLVEPATEPIAEPALAPAA
jgi:cation diffusion facilitator CzcD-associated flavoprotein CzcO